MIQQFVTCPIHDEPTEVRQGVEPDENWQARLASLKKLFEESHRPFPVVHDVAAVEERGQFFVAQSDLHRAGTRLSSIGEGFYLFELDDGWVYETQGWDESRRRWWVERVVEAAPVAD